ncbi:trigger factor [Bacilli bacterium]|nr:trigger factor [Bacilli bacterium]
MEVKKTLIKDFELKKEFDVVIPLDVVVAEVEKTILDSQKTYKLDGFRNGKVPVELIRKREFKNYFYEVAENFVDRVSYDISKENGYKLALRPKADLKVMDTDKDIEFVVIYELLPNIEEIDLKAIELDDYKVSVGDEDVEKSVKKLLSTYKKWKQTDRAAQMGDTAKIDFVGTIDGEEFSGGRAEGYRLELGSKSFIDNFEEQIVGRSAGDEFDVNVVFPEDYHKSSIARKPALFRVKLIEVLEAEDRASDDDFIKNLFGYESASEFRGVIRNILLENYADLSKNAIKLKICGYLEENVVFDVPEGLVEEQYDRLLAWERKNNLKRLVNDEIDAESIRKRAEKSVRVGLIMSNIGKINNIVVSDSEITNAVMKEALASKNRDMAIIDYYKNDSQALQLLRSNILEDKIMDFIIDNINKNEIEMTAGEFESIVNNKAID